MNKIHISLGLLTLSMANPVFASEKINASFLGKWATSQLVCKQGMTGNDTDSRITIKPNIIQIESHESLSKININKINFNEQELISGTGESHWSSEGEEGSEYTSFAYLKRNGAIFALASYGTKYIKCN